jgi:hypothetical protein
MSQPAVSRCRGGANSSCVNENGKNPPFRMGQVKIKLRNVAHLSAAKNRLLKHHASHPIHHSLTTFSPSQNTHKNEKPQ